MENGSTNEARSSDSSGRKAFRVSVMASIVASVVVGIFLNPILSWFSDAAIGFVGVFYGGYLDRIYSAAAKSPENSMLFELFYWVMCMIAMFIVLLGYSLSRVRNSTSSLQRIGSYVLKSGANFSHVTAILTTVIVLLFVADITTNFVKLRISSNFHRNIIALSPYISDTDNKKLNSEWVLIQKKADYTKLMAEIADFAESYHAQLPK